jgi:hypothetical protein
MASTAHAHNERHRAEPERAVGLTLAAIHPVACDGPGNCTGGNNDGLMWGGVATTAVSLLFGLPLALTRDSVSIDVVRSPDARLLLPGRARESGMSSPATADGLGLALRGAF